MRRRWGWLGRVVGRPGRASLEGAQHHFRAHRADPLDPPGALDPHLVTGVDHHLGDQRVQQPAFQTAQARSFGDGVERRRGRGGCLGRGAHAAPRAGWRAGGAGAPGGGRRRRRERPPDRHRPRRERRPSACSMSRARRARPGSRTSTTPVGGRARTAARRNARKHGRMTSNDWAPDASKAAGGSPVPASTMTGARWCNAVARSSQRSAAVAPDAPRGMRASWSPTETANLASAASSAFAECSHSWTPGPCGSLAPSATGASPARSTSSVGWRRAESSASAAATTVVPLPPFTDQQTTTDALGATGGMDDSMTDPKNSKTARLGEGPR